MSIYFGNDTVNDLYVGLTPVSKGYVGTHLFYNGDSTIIDFTYEKYILNTGFGTLYNTKEAPVKSAILTGQTLVKMPVVTTTGKNLFDGKWANGGIGNTNGLDGGGTSNIRTVNHISVKPNTTYVASSSQLQHANVIVWYAYDKDKKFISYSTASNSFITPSNCEFIRARTFDGDSTNISLDCVLQIEEGPVATEYEPYKSTTVTCNEEVKLREIGDVRDELDLLTGELTRRIDESGNVLSREITESIDISTVDQDGNNTKLSSFEDITYVTVTSEGLIPEAELEVATKNEEDLEDSSVYTTHTLSEVFNTLYNTEEKRVKSAILKGDMLVNLSTLNGEITIAPNKVQFIDSPLKSSTTYTVSFNCSSAPSTGSIEVRQVIGDTAMKMENKSVIQGYNQFILLSSSSGAERIRLKNDSTSETDFIFNNLMILEGDYRQVDIPYFEGVVSVKMPVLTTTGKNIVGDLEIGSLDANGNNTTVTLYTRSSFILLKKDTTYTFSLNGVKRSFHLYRYDLNKNFKVKVGMANEYTPEVDCYIRIFQMDDLDKALYQVEVGSLATKYEPYKSTTVTCNEEVVLRGIGDVKDELNLLTGELTRRINENGNILSQEITESIDISVVDQDGNDTKLSTFDDLTHVTVTSEGLIPEAMLEVPEKVTELAASMLSISREQEVVNTATNEQSENVDATMIATTEIYEALL